MATWSWKREGEGNEFVCEGNKHGSLYSVCTYPLIAVDRPNALLHDSKLSDAQLFVDGYGVRWNDMFVGRRRLAQRLVHRRLVCKVVRVLPAGRRVELQLRSGRGGGGGGRCAESACKQAVNQRNRDLRFYHVRWLGGLQEAFDFAQVPVRIVLVIELSQATDFRPRQSDLFKVLIAGVF